MFDEDKSKSKKYSKYFIDEYQAQIYGVNI